MTEIIVWFLVALSANAAFFAYNLYFNTRTVKLLKECEEILENARRITNG